MDEQVAVAFIGCDEAKSLLVAEPLDRSGWHLESASVARSAATAEDVAADNPEACTCFSPPDRMRTALRRGTLPRRRADGWLPAHALRAGHTSSLANHGRSDADRA